MQNIIILIFIIVVVLSGCLNTNNDLNNSKNELEFKNLNVDLNVDNDTFIIIGNNTAHNVNLPGFMLYGKELQNVKAIKKFDYIGGNFIFIDSDSGKEMSRNFPENEFIEKITLDRGIQFQDSHRSTLSLIDMDNNGIVDRYLLERGGCKKLKVLIENNCTTITLL